MLGNYCLKINSTVFNSILFKSKQYTVTVFILKQLSQAKHQSQVDTAESVLARSPISLRQVLECCKEKGASSWLSAIPIEQHGFTLHKTDFTDALCERYGWFPSHLPSHRACGKAFSVSHTFSYLHSAISHPPP